VLVSSIFTEKTLRRGVPRCVGLPYEGVSIGRHM
jgi:hypothetical protein